MIYRYMRVFNSTQRQQTKWLIFGFALILPLNPLYAAIGGLSGAFNTPDSPYQLLEPTVLTLIVLVVLLSISFAILRYRLWDIDLLINRTLVYSALTVILTGVYVGLVIGLQALLRGIISQDNSVAIVISTLAIYALFQPLRRHIQRIIDRRFYRSKYDATKTVAAFSATLRQEVDLDQLREHLLAVVQETMQPAHVSLWLRPPEHGGTQRAPWRATPPVSSEGR
jgi:divalent metal cation (Fe/Co/Zn/Cd) transporter